VNKERVVLAVCMGIAFVCWFITKLSDTYQSSFMIGLDYKLMEHKTLSETAPATIEVVVRAKGWDLLGIRPPQVSIDLRNLPSLELNASMLEGKIQKNLPGNIKVLQLHPDHLLMRVEDEATKIIPVSLDWQGELAPQHSLIDTPKVYPEQVQITGPSSVIRNIHSWQTVPLIRQSVKNSIREKIELKTPTNAQLKFSPQTVETRVNVQQITEKRLDIPVSVLNVPDSLLLLAIPARIALTCVVGLADYNRLSASGFEAVADFAEKNGADNQLRVRLVKTPAYVQSVQFSPRKIDYLVRNKK
jgi:YbbR domain-containing protein